MLNATQSCKITIRIAVGIAEVDSRPETGEAIVGTRVRSQPKRENIKIVDRELYKKTSCSWSPLIQASIRSLAAARH